MTLLEAMAAGKPIVATAAGSIPRIIRNQENGVIIQPREARPLYDALSFLIQRPSFASCLASRAQADVQVFSAKEMGNKYITLYDELLQSKSISTPA